MSLHNLCQGPDVSLGDCGIDVSNCCRGQSATHYNFLSMFGHGTFVTYTSRQCRTIPDEITVTSISLTVSPHRIGILGLRSQVVLKRVLFFLQWEGGEFFSPKTPVYAQPLGLE